MCSCSALPTLSSGHHAGGREIAQTPTETPTPGSAEAGKSEEQLQKEVEAGIKQIQKKTGEQLEKYQRQLDSLFLNLKVKLTEQAERYEDKLSTHRDSKEEEINKIKEKFKTDIAEKAEEAKNSINLTLEEVEKDAEEADRQRGLAERHATEADRQRGLAEDRATEADRQRGLAEDRANKAEEQRRLAEVRAKHAEMEYNMVNQVKTNADKAIEQFQNDAKEIVNRSVNEYEKLEAGISEMRGQIKAIAIFGSVAAVLTTILLSSLVSKILALVEFSPDRLKKHEERIDKLEEKIENR